MAGKAAAGEPLGRTAEEVAWAETLRGACEPEHHWRYRREFLLRNVGELPAAGSAQLQRLVSLSMVWANHVFLGCRYPPQVMEKALEMAEGIQVTNAPVRTTRDELVAKVKKRGISSSNEGVEEPCKRQAIEKSRDSKDAGKDVKTTKAEGVKESESTLPKKQEKGTSKDPKTSQSTCSSDQEMVIVSDIETEGKPANAESTAEQKPPSSEKEPGKKPCSSPPKESKCENVPSPEKKTTVSAAPLAAESTPQPDAVVAALPPAAKSTPQAAVVPSASKSTPQAAAVPATAKSTPQAAAVPAAVPVTAKSTPQAAAVPAAVPPAAKSTPQATSAAAAVPLTTKSTPQVPAVPPTTKSTPQTSAALLSSKTQVNAPASVSKSGAQVSSSLLLAPKSGTQVGTSLLLASKGPAKVGSPLLASKSSAEVAASLLAARSGAQPGSSLLTSKSSAQVAASLLAARSGAQQGPSRGGAQAGASLLASKSGSQAGESPAKALCKPLTSEDAKERQPFFNRLYKAVAWKLVAVGGFSPNVNHAELLNSSIQSVKATLDVAFVPLKELADLPQNKSSLENIVCELRCKSVYLGTGCGKSMENAKAVASREALKLFLKKKVIVKICKRKYKGSEIEDLVLLDEESKPSNLPPALRNPREIL
ncbi:CDKN2A-interacting protein isoform X1 [Cyanistes caeruleus]|uniref:CDKN2A-interacting protein isoform X1 n=1 Tax=Cyanistes caeruleus TaxID=156563 RepID=UPI000CDB90F5|nr:CDKN2A-interacting protein isoform X1 [Cyanistes caeruleus]